MCVYRKHALLSESIQLRVVEVLTAFVNNVTDGVRTLERSGEPEEIDQYRSAFKVSVYFLIMTLTALSHQLLQQEKDIVAKVRPSSLLFVALDIGETFAYYTVRICFMLGMLREEKEIDGCEPRELGTRRGNGDPGAHQVHLDRDVRPLEDESARRGIVQFSAVYYGIIWRANNNIIM